MQNSTKDNIIHQNVSRRPSPTKIVFVWLAATLIFGVFVGIGLSRYFALFETSRTGVSFNVINKSAPDNVVVKDLDMSKFWKVLGLVEDNYLDVSDVDPSDIVDGAINGMMAALGDPYTSYYSDEQNQGFKDDLEGVYGGVGAQLGFKDDRLAIIAPLEG
ncbi:hypothetical protein KC614_01720, partial [candidate division WWE3 bacterium]|nr:hypothetical protein [candidate division WWE3 bacterium]